jgi:O-antigen ligase
MKRGGLQIGWDYFPLGVGLGNVGALIMDFSHMADHGFVTHDSYIDMWAETGPVGVILLIVTLCSVIPSIRVRRWRVMPGNFAQNVGVAMCAIWVCVILALSHYSLTFYTLIYYVLALMSIWRYVKDEDLSPGGSSEVDIASSSATT